MTTTRSTVYCPYLAVSYPAWGVGSTPEIAKRTVKRLGGNLNRVVIFLLPLGALEPWVDDFGAIRWTWGDDAPDKNAPLKIRYQRGMKDFAAEWDAATDEDIKKARELHRRTAAAVI